MNNTVTQQKGTEKKPKRSPAEQFLKDLQYTSDSYLYSVILSGVTAAGGIGIAILYDVTIGLCAALASVIMYIAFTKNTLYNGLGIAYTSASGELTITELYGKKREEVFIPSSLMYMDVCAIGDRAFKHASSAKIHTVHLPATLKVIGKDIFKGCTALTTVYFEGSEKEFLKIDSKTDFSGYEIIFFDSSAFKLPQKPKKSKKADAENGDAQ